MTIFNTHRIAREIVEAVRTESYERIQVLGHKLFVRGGTPLMRAVLVMANDMGNADEVYRVGAIVNNAWNGIGDWLA